MQGVSALNLQNIAPSNNVEIETQTAEERAAEDAEKQKTEFLTLLLTQLENQNPLDPLDTDEWTAQLTRYSILEQGIDTNAKLAVTNEYLQTNANNTSLSYIGEEVEVSTNLAPLQNGEASWSYTVDGDAESVTITVLDENDVVIYEEEGSTLPGTHDFTLNTIQEGLDVAEGAPLELVIATRDENGARVPVRSTSYAVVDGIWTDADNTYLTAGNVSFRREDILKINDLAAGGTTGTPNI